MTKGIKRFYPDGQLIKIITFKLYIGYIIAGRRSFGCARLTIIGSREPDYL